MASDELDSLFAAPPTEFVAERKRIAAALKGAGRRDDAKAIEKIPRPSLAVWTVNQIARHDPALVRRLVAITDRLREAGAAAYPGAAAGPPQAPPDPRPKAAGEREVKRLREAETAARKNVDRAERAVAAAQESLADAEARLAEERTAAEKAAQALAEAEADLARLSGD